ncbi:MAG TPA: sialidase family protein [Candidatus Dormibacteraeota bacterium]|nr:sialidase family protein [Candidatus Dormibacteraeota bacterium]
MALLAAPLLLVAWVTAAPPAVGSNGGSTLQGPQSDADYANSVLTHHVTNIEATAAFAGPGSTGVVSCYRPEVPFGTSLGPNDGYDGETTCPGANTGEDTGANGYATQANSNPGFPASSPMLVKDHSESDIRVDPTNSNHLIGTVKWFVSAEGYNHLLGFYESFDGGKTWPVQGHIPGYEGWTDNTDPVGAFDGFGNFYELILPYQFFYLNGGHSFQTNPNKEPNPGEPAEVISIAVRPHGSTSATQWTTKHNGVLDVVSPYPDKGQEPDKQWITIDSNPASPNYNTIYAMWVVFDGINSKPFVSWAKANQDGTHSDWSTPELLPTVNNTASDTYLLPHVAPDGTAWTSVTNFPSQHGKCCISVSTDSSSDGGKTWVAHSIAIHNVLVPSFVGGYANTTFTDGIDNTFAVGTNIVNGHYPLYIAYNQEDTTAAVSNVFLTTSVDGGATWSPSIKVNDNVNPVDEFQPNLAVAGDGTVSVNFYDRRLRCAVSGTTEADRAGLALDQVNPNFSGSRSNAFNYCINESIQFYSPTLTALDHNIRLSQHTWDPQLNSPVRFCTCEPNATFIGDYFGNVFSGNTDFTTTVTTFNDGTNPMFRQQQLVAAVQIP